MEGLGSNIEFQKGFNSKEQGPKQKQLEINTNDLMENTYFNKVKVLFTRIILTILIRMLNLWLITTILINLI